MQFKPFDCRGHWLFLSMEAMRLSVSLDACSCMKVDAIDGSCRATHTCSFSRCALALCLCVVPLRCAFEFDYFWLKPELTPTRILGHALCLAA